MCTIFKPFLCNGDFSTILGQRKLCSNHRVYTKLPPCKLLLCMVYAKLACHQCGGIPIVMASSAKFNERLPFVINESVARRLTWFDADARFHFITLYRWMWIERVQWASAQFENFNSRLRPALDPKPRSLACWTCYIQQNGTWIGIVSHHWNASLCAADSLMTTKSLTLPKLPTRLGDQ